MRVYVLIHEMEPSDSGSDFRRASFLPIRFDTDIVGVFSSYQNAKRAAVKYVSSNLGVDVEEIDWLGDGWQDLEAGEEPSVIGPSIGRVHVEEHELDEFHD